MIHYNRLEKLARDKHSGLLGRLVIYVEKKCCDDATSDTKLFNVVSKLQASLFFNAKHIYLKLTVEKKPTLVGFHVKELTPTQVKGVGSDDPFTILHY